MSSIKQVIVNAIMRIATPDPAVEPAVYESAEAARDDFVKKLLAELFPENPGTEMPPVKVKKPRAKKAAEAAVDQLTDSLAAMSVAEPAVAEEKPAKKPRAKKPQAEKPAEEGSNAAAVPPPAEEKPAKKPRAKKAKAEAPVAVPAADGSNAAAVPPAEEKPAKKPRAKKAEAGEAVKLTAAQVTKAKEIAKTVGVEFDKKAFLMWMGQLTEEERREPLEVMVRAYLSPVASSAAPAPSPKEVVDVGQECVAVEFDGEEYWVNPVTRVVFKTEIKPDGKGEVDIKVGMVGLAKFEHMVVPTE
jgi:hypothetical protein